MSLQIKEHLYQLYPQMPQYAADPSQSQIIKIYDHIMLRFAGHYGRALQYYVKSPLCPILFGSLNNYINLDYSLLCSNQNIIIAIGTNSSKKIRINHYETTLYGQIQISTSVEDWKFKIRNQEQNKNIEEDVQNEHYNNFIKVLKAFSQENLLKQLVGMDILIYKDFLEDDFLYSKGAFINGLYTALHVAMLKNIKLNVKSIEKANLKTFQNQFINICKYQVSAQFNKICQVKICSKQNIQQVVNKIKFPQNLQIVLINSMTPQPQKYIKGKRFNLRECQVMIAIQLIKSELGSIKDIRSLRQLQECIDCTIEQLLETVESCVPKTPLTVEQIQKITQKSLIQILKHIPYANNVIDQNSQYQAYKRIKYFLLEQKIQKQLTQNPQKIVELIKQSSKNAKQLLQIESQQVAQILQIAQSWSIAYKIIGDGWGGNVMLICQKTKTQKMIDQLINKFFLDPKNKILLSDDIQMYISRTGKPNSGLGILNPENQIWFG